MRNLLFFSIIFVCLVFGWIFLNHGFDNGWVYLLSVGATALLGYLVCDHFFQEEKKVLVDQLDQNNKDLQLHKNELDILKTQAALSTPQSEVADLQKRFEASENDRADLKGTLASQALTISALNKQIEEYKQTIATLTPPVVVVEPTTHVEDPHTSTDVASVVSPVVGVVGVSELISHDVHVEEPIVEVHHDVIAEPALELPTLHEVIETPHVEEPVVEVHHDIIAQPLFVSPTVLTIVEEVHQVLPTEVVQPETTHFLSEGVTPNGAEFMRRNLKSEDDIIEHTPVESNVVELEVAHQPIIPSIFTAIAEETHVEQHIETHVLEASPIESPEPHSTELPPLDDLKIVEGIGPRIELILYNGGIRTFKDLSETRVDRLKEILIAAGKNPNFNDPSTWPEQARLLANGEMDKFKAYTKWLDGGRIPGID